MKVKTGEYIAVHREPVWRESSSFIFHAHMGEVEGKNEWEQLWGRIVGPGRVALCCIPFFIYDVSLGDEIILTTDNILSEVVQRSGQIIFRVWFGEQDPLERKKVIQEIKAIKPLMEWSSENLLALSASKETAQRLADYLFMGEQQRLLRYEAGATE